MSVAAAQRAAPSGLAGTAHQAPRWAMHVLLAAGAYNLAWGALAVLLPAQWFSMLGMEIPRYLPIWQSVGMIVGVYGIAYMIAAYDAFRHWPIVLVGLIGKVLGPIGFVFAASAGELPWLFGWTIITNDLIWWVPFGAILYQAARTAQAEGGRRWLPGTRLDTVLRETHTATGLNLKMLSDNSPVMLVFLRHFGCVFCLEALRIVARFLGRIRATGTEVVLVHMSDPASASNHLRRFGLDGLEHISDPDRRLYRYFDLKRGSFRQLFGLKAILSAVRAVKATNRIGGKLEGDGFQMPGLVVLHKGRVIDVFRHRSVADRPDYVRHAEQARTVARGVQVGSL